MSQEKNKVNNEQVIKEIHDWHTRCASCGYGAGGWVGAWNGEDTPPLEPDSKTCHGCGKDFTHVSSVSSHPDYSFEPRPIEE
jgi:hypothetical protein